MNSDAISAWLTGSRSVLRSVERPEKVSRSIGRYSVDSAAADCHNDAAGADEDAVLGYSNISRARLHSNTARQGRPTSDSKSRCSIDREHRRIQHSTPCRKILLTINTPK